MNDFSANADLSAQEIAQLIHRVLHATGEEREHAVQHLAGVIRQVVNRVAARRHIREDIYEDLCNDAISKIWEKLGQFAPSRGSFHSWCYRIVDNLFMDIVRARKRGRKVLNVRRWKTKPISFKKIGFIAAGVIDEDAVEKAELRKDEPDVKPEAVKEEGGFSQSQLLALNNVPLLRRVICLAATGLYRRVPNQLWDSWVQQLGLLPPYPPDFRSCSDDKEILKHLAKIHGIGPSAVKQHLYRGAEAIRKVLQEDFEE